MYRAIDSIEACFDIERLRLYFKFRDVSLSENLHRCLSGIYKSLCKISERETSRNSKYGLKRAVLKHASIGTIGVDNCWILSCKTHIHWKGKGLFFHYCSNCHHCSKIKCTMTLKRDAIFGLSHGSVRNWPSQKSINPFLRACVHCVSNSHLATT